MHRMTTMLVYDNMLTKMGKYLLSASTISKQVWLHKAFYLFLNLSDRSGL